MAIIASNQWHAAAIISVMSSMGNISKRWQQYQNGGGVVMAKMAWRS